MKGSQNKNKGFSLLEVLIAVVILTVVIVPLTNTFISSSKVNQKSKRVLSATDIAQNMFEGITASKPEDAILELSARSLSKNVDLKNKLSVLPVNDGYDQIEESTVTVTRTATDVTYGYTWIPATDSGIYVKSKRLIDASTNKYKCRGFVSHISEDPITSSDPYETEAYGFSIQGLREGNTYYDVVVTLDPSAYKSSYVTGSISYAELARISGINKKYDSVYQEGASHLDNDVTSQFRNKRLGGLRTESDILNYLQRTYKVNIHNIGTAASPEIVVDVGVDYKYLIPGEIVAGITSEPGSGPEEYKEEAQTIFDSKDTEHNPRNVFIFYVPNYASRAGGTVLDNFEINNDEDLDVNVYLIRTEQTESVAFGTDNKTTFERERDYAANVMINEKDDAKINTAIRTNLEDNLTKDYDDADRKRSPSHITYNIDIPGSTKLADLRTAFSSETVDASEEESRKYDVEIKVYRGKSGGSGDNNGYINYDGAAENGFPKEDILTTFTGSLVQ